MKTPLETPQDAVPQTTSPLVALVGNPNTGKTSVFNMLTGARRRVGNYPGVTVETTAGLIADEARTLELLDLPGTYSLAARSPDEMIVVDCLLGCLTGVRRPDAVLVVADASNLERNLFLTTQVLEIGLPVVVALNMIDVAERNRVELNVALLSRRLGVTVVPVVARTGRGRAELVAAVQQAVGSSAPSVPAFWPANVAQSAGVLAKAVHDRAGEGAPPSYEILRCLLDVGGYAEQRLLRRFDGGLRAVLDAERARLERGGISLPALEATLRYRWIEEVTRECLRRERSERRRMSERIDDVLTHRLLGSLIFVLVVGAMFVSVFAWAEPLMQGIEGALAWLAGQCRAALGSGILGSFLADGVVLGAGSVLAFLPQILVLFAFITIMEDCGYLARAAFLMDRLLRGVGLGGRSFVPLLSCFACAVPGIMSARTIENPRERLVTILVAPLMACSARIPIYTLLVAAFVPRQMVLGFLPLQGLVFTALYVFGIVMAALAALVFRRVLFKGPDAPFLLELPDYKLPGLRTVVLRLYDRARVFVFTAGTIILAMSVIIWALLYFPRPPQLADAVRVEQAAAGVTDATLIDHAVAGAYLRQSYFGRTGRALEPAFRPLGWDWKIGMATLASFPAREVIISTLGIVYNLGPAVNEQSPALRDKLRAAEHPDGSKVFSLPVALSIMVFFALCCQCQATVAVIRRETNSWRWPAFTFAYMTVLAYVAALVVYQVGIRIS